MRINHLPENIECTLVFKAKAYFQNSGLRIFYEFKNEREADEWRRERSLKNRREKIFEYFMACNEEGEFSYLKLYKLHSSIGILPPQLYCLSMYHDYQDFLGVEIEDYSDEDDTVKNLLLDNQDAKKNKSEINRTEKINGKDRERKLKQLTNASNLQEYMGELFLSEIKKSNDKSNEFLRNRIKILNID